ncbi:hypothetical protein [Arthrobacter sp. NPDC090010]|uniref:hypothetical protein n=1 Tax=Arthrobacter sp. NPDC090010 TaxID=3363942 RepID=UPI0038169E0D
MGAALDAVIAGEAVTLTRSGRAVGSLEFRAIVLEGTIVDVPVHSEPPGTMPDGVIVVATAMTLSETAQRRLSDELGVEYIVLDITKAPSNADVLLTRPVSPQLLGILQHKFPDARVLIAEIEDEELGISYSGPVSQLLDAGASAYLPPRPIAGLAADVRGYLMQGRHPGLELEDRPGRSLPARARGQIDR